MMVRRNLCLNGPPRARGTTLMLFMLGIVILLISVVASQVHATEPVHMTLLAVQETNDTFTGSSADLFLEVQPGRGRVFLETFPFTKMDTQISTRFAKEIACNYFELPCTDKDFIYTIQSDANIIGGPSAGAALAALTTAAILDLPVNQKVAVTGTINSGGLIGPVSGLKAKINAANDAGIKTILIPKGSKLVLEDNRTDLIQYGKTMNITVIEAGDLDEVIYWFAGKKLLDGSRNITPNQEYVAAMRDISSDICGRTKDLKNTLDAVGMNQTEREDIINITQKADEAANRSAYYSAASFCFGLNVKLHSLLYARQNISEAKILSKSEQLRQDIARLERKLEDQELHTITDLQAMTIVKARLAEAKEYIERLKKENDNLADKDKNENEENRRYLLAFAEERFSSVRSWLHIFGIEGRQYELNKRLLERSCIEKLQEAKERIHYVSLFIHGGIRSIEEGAQEADKHRINQQYELCLAKASESKAQANAILSTVGFDQKELDDLVQYKLSALEKLIARTNDRHAFPILGFSYHEYAKSLRADNPSSALLYAEYALELSNLDIYFEPQAKLSPRQALTTAYKRPRAYFSAGLAAGILSTALFLLLLRQLQRLGTATEKKPQKKSSR